MAIPGFPVKPGEDGTKQIVRGVIRAARDPAGAFERATAAVQSRNFGDDLIGVARGVERVVDQQTGGLVSSAREIAGSVQEVFASPAEGFAGIAQGVERAIDQQTGGLLTGAKELYGTIKEELFPSGTAAGSPAEVLEDIGGDVAGVVGGIAENFLAPFNGLSQWGRLSDKLIARIFPCDADGKEITTIADGLFIQNDVRGPITEANFECSLNWQSPFENAGPESKAPALMAMLQTGQIATVANALQAVLPSDGAIGSVLQGTAEKTAQYAKDLQGRTGITKLNSRQVFSGMPPLKITMVLHFRAMTDPQSEVVEPYKRLLEWALPQKLAADGVLAEVVRNGSEDFIKALFPSLAPQMVGFTYANERYSPMVIESIGNPIDGPKSVDGLPLYRAVQISLATLTALDRNDVAAIFSRSTLT